MEDARYFGKSVCGITLVSVSQIIPYLTQRSTYLPFMIEFFIHSDDELRRFQLFQQIVSVDLVEQFS
ncbi:hypothetical protein G352_26237 [Rhodococcus ruber BKS 20-38]|uniref:Uncharacterized protein n=1 Tax=Rhodococcus ruber BKS 20-38 TaxID=1278076 RepID=M2WRD5_9NOCA|nr:hypothetical protein G352_26237 [Rhodococcus ruber BKS 20-38]